LVAAFDSNDFDAFDLHLESLPGDQPPSGESNRHFHWSKFPHMMAISSQPTWKLSLDLVTTSNLRRGSLVVYRIYGPRDLQLDVNLLISEFPTALADALGRAKHMPDVLVPAERSDNRYLAANL
jgi:hypothetical protein